MTANKIDHKTLKQELEAVYPRLWRYCLALTRDRSQAEDLAQAACLRAMEKISLFDPATHFDRWIFTIAHRMRLNDLRSNSVRQGAGLVPVEETELVDQAPNPESNILGREVFTGVMQLPEPQRMAVLLVYVEGYSYKETAAVLDIPIGTVMSRLAAARAKLAGQFGPAERD